MLVHIAGDRDVSARRVKLDSLAFPLALEAAAWSCGAPDVQAASGGGDLDVGALVVREQRASCLVRDAVLVEAGVQVDTADAVAEDEAEGRAGRARGLIRAPGRRVGDGCPRARACAHGPFVDVVDPAVAGGQLDGEAGGFVGSGRAVMSNSASSAAKARVGSRPGFELVAAVFARFHVSYCNAYFVDIPQNGWG
nr:MAG TPA: hypothetical protein [Caudoviricetes sp.]